MIVELLLKHYKLTGDIQPQRRRWKPEKWVEWIFKSTPWASKKISR